MEHVVPHKWRMVAYRGNYALYTDHELWYVVNHATDEIITSELVLDETPPPVMPQSNGTAAIQYAMEYRRLPNFPPKNDGSVVPTGVETPDGTPEPSPQNEHVG